MYRDYYQTGLDWTGIIIVEILKLMHCTCLLNHGHIHLIYSLFSEGTTPAVEHEEPELLDMLNMMVSKVTAPIMMSCFIGILH